MGDGTSWVSCPETGRDTASARPRAVAPLYADGGSPLADEDLCSWAGRVRRGLEARGALFTHPAASEAARGAPAAPLGAGHPYQTERRQEEGPAEDAAWGGVSDDRAWDLLARLGWTLHSDGVVTDLRALDFFRGQPALAAWVGARALDLSYADPLLGSKKWGHLLQFVVLGADWYRALRAAPLLANYLEGEVQDVDLEGVLARPRR